MNTKGVFTTVLLACALMQARAQSAAFDWAVSMGGNGTDWGTGIATDRGRNIYTVGSFEGTAVFGHGTNMISLISHGGSDLFIQKIDNALGVVFWAISIGGTGDDYATSVAIDDSGHVYIAGYFKDTVDFDPGPGTTHLISQGNFDVFVLKLDENGNFRWAKSMGGALDDFGNAISVEPSGNVYVTGTFYGTADFDPGPDTTELSSHGNADIFIVKLDVSGDLQWAKSMGGHRDDFGYAVKADPSGHVYATGIFRDTVDFNSEPGTSNLVAHGNPNVYVIKLDSDGSFTWVNAIGGNMASIYGNSLARDESGNIYITGRFVGTVDFDPGPGTAIYASSGIESDVYILKLDASGNFLWARYAGGTDNLAIGLSITVDIMEDVHVTGVFTGKVDFNPGLALAYLTAYGVADGFVLSLDRQGDFRAARVMGGLSGDLGTSIATDSAGYLYITGVFSGMAYFGSGAEIIPLTSRGSYDIFVGKFIQGRASGMFNNNFGEALQAFPNPTTGRFTIELGKPYPGISLTLRNLHGQLLRSTRIGTESPPPMMPNVCMD